MQSESLSEFRCPSCGHLLFKSDGKGAVQIKCRWCHSVIETNITGGASIVTQGDKQRQKFSKFETKHMTAQPTTQSVYNQHLPAKKREEKAFSFHVLKSNAELGQVEAIVSVMGILDLVDDVIHPGAYVKTISERAGKIRILDNHRQDSSLAAIGKPITLKELSKDELPTELVKEYPTATGALLAVIQFDMDTEEGSGVFKRLQSGSLNEWSIGFDVIKWDKEYVVIGNKKTLVRNIREIRLWEISAVLFGANQATTTLEVRNDNMPKDKPSGAKATPPNYMMISDDKQHNRCQSCQFFDPAGHCIKYGQTVEPNMICDSYDANSGSLKAKQGEGKAEVEMVESETVVEIEKSIGAEISGALFDTYSLYTSSYVKRGLLTAEEFLALAVTGTDMLNFLKSAIPVDVYERSCEEEYSMMFWSHEGAEAVKRFVTNYAQKSGRVLSQANLGKLQNALAQIEEVLSSAQSASEVEANESTDENKGKPKDDKAEPLEKALTYEKDLQNLRDGIKSLKGE